MVRRREPAFVVTGGMKEPPGHSLVTVRCEPCVQRLGRSSPTLAVVDIGDGQYVVYRPKRISAGQRDRIRAAAGDVLDDDDPPDDGDRFADRALWVSVATEAPWMTGDWEGPEPERLRIEGPKGVELACPRCRHRPRKRVRALYELAEQALAEDRFEVYL